MSTIEDLYKDAKNPNNSGLYGNIITDGDGTTIVRGTGGGFRHTGQFSPDNPYLAQLAVASKNQDKDALYELAVKWEADRANTLEQREYNEEVLREQRDYDSPLARLQRERAAGINGDLAGGTGATGSSGSSAQMNVSNMPQQQGQTKFANAYDTTNMVMQGFQTAGSFASAVTSLGTGVVGAIDTLSTLPGRNALASAQSNLMNTQANVANELLPGQKSSIGIDNASKMFQNIMDLSGIFTGKESDESMTSTMSALGYSDELIPKLIGGVREFNNNPRLKAYHDTGVLNARKAKVANQKSTEQLLGQMFDASVNRQIAEDTYNFVRSNFETDLIEAFNLAGGVSLQTNATVSGLETQIDSNQTAQDQNELLRKFIKNDIDSFVELLDQKDTQLLKLEKERDEIVKLMNDAKGEWKLVYESRLESINQDILALKSSRAQELYGMYDVIKRNVITNDFIQFNLKKSGRPHRGRENINRINQLFGSVFTQYINNEMSNDELGKKIFDGVNTAMSTVMNMAAQSAKAASGS